MIEIATVRELTDWCEQNLLDDSWSSFYKEHDRYPNRLPIVGFEHEVSNKFKFKHHRYHFYFNDEESFIQFKLAWD